MPHERLAIITQSDGLSEPAGAAVITDPAELLALLELDPALLAPAREAARLFPIRVPRTYVQRMRKGDPDDPLLRQVLGSIRETETVAGFSQDPLAEQDASPAPGILHKYQGRVLLMVSSTCGVHCRYCFRRHFPYDNHGLHGQALEQALAWLRAHPEVDEVILSGGDPLVLSDRRLAALLDALARLPTLRRLRIHSRQPVVMPERLTEALQQQLLGFPQPVTLVLHSNHPRELDQTLARALAPLRQGVTLLNQSVLLAGVNDDEQVLATLSERLFDVGVLPYYLHLLDPVAGAAHFQVPIERARDLHRALQARLPGYLVPRLVQELAGRPAKTLVSAD